MNKLKKVTLYLYGFLLFYQLNIDAILPFNIQFMMIMILCINIILNIYWIIYGRLNKDILLLIFGILVSGIYLFIRYLLANNFSFKTNLFSAVLIINGIFLYKHISRVTNDKLYFIKLLLNLALMQSLLSILMLIFPKLKNIANFFYLHDKNSVVYVWTTWYRVYGLTGDFTSATPMLHGFIGAMSLYLGTVVNKKYYLYTPFILIVILLNGRWGIAIMLLSYFFSMIPYYKNKKAIRHIFKFSTFSIALFIPLFLIIKNISPRTYDWLIGGFNELTSLFFIKEKTGNVESLLGNMIFFPEKSALLFGRGTRVFGDLGRQMGYENGSDIGYINDLFAGGIIYMSFHYYNILSYLIQRNKKIKAVKINKSLSILLVTTLLLANFKGEVLQGGGLLTAVIFVKYGFMSIDCEGE